MSDKSKSSEVVFLLGAGASVKAGVPDTFSFVKEFQQNIVDTEVRRTIDTIIDTLQEWRGSDIDIELLLETLTKLDSKEKEPLLKFFEHGQFILNGYPEKQPIINELKVFIKKKTVIKSQTQIKYFEPFLGFIEEHRPLDIISFNYDTCIEQFCNEYKLTYQDGFDVNWNPMVFEHDADIRLYKLHGSVIWYRSDRAGYIKLPVLTEDADIQLITGEKAESLMLYPMQKFDYAEPLLELLIQARNIIQSCKILVAVGYSFRDTHIQKIILDVARKNRELKLIVIDPKAFSIYEDKLKYFDQNARIPSSLDGRVICLPYVFEKVLPFFRKDYLDPLKRGLLAESDHLKSERIGNKDTWLDCLGLFSKAEYTEKVDSLLKDHIEKEEIDESWLFNLEICFETAINLVANGLLPKAEKYIEDIKNILKRVMLERFDLQILDNRIVFKFNNQRGQSEGIQQLKANISDLYQHLISHLEMTNKKEILKEKFVFLENVMNYLLSFEQVITIENLLQLRENKVSKKLIQELKSLPSSDGNLIKNIEEQLIVIEKTLIASLLS